MHLYFDVFFLQAWQTWHRYYINVYESAIHTCGYWLPACPPVRPANQGCNLIRVWTSESLRFFCVGSFGRWDSFGLSFAEPLDVGCLEKPLIQIYSEQPTISLCGAKDAVNCTNSREERPYEYIAGFKASWAGSLDPRECWWLSSWLGG